MHVLLWILAVGARTEPRPFMMHLLDPDGVVKGSLEVRLTMDDGYERVLQPTDDGQRPDSRAKDNTWTAAVPDTPVGQLHVEAVSGERRWSLVTTLNASPNEQLLRMRFQRDNTLTVLPPADSAAPNHSPRTNAAAPTVSNVGAWLPWALFGASALGFTWAVLRRPRRVRAAPLRGASAPHHRVWRLDPTQLDLALVQGPLQGRRLVVVGDPPVEDAWVCQDPAPLPAELVLAVERLAAEDGAPVALLVREPRHLDGGLEDLARRIDGRFPLMVLGGPADWPTWPPEPEPDYPPEPDDNE